MYSMGNDILSNYLRWFKLQSWKVHYDDLQNNISLTA